jgi:hypothetical protein
LKPLNAEIIRLYSDELKSTDQISDQLACEGINLSPELIRYRLRSYGVQMRARGGVRPPVHCAARRPSRAKPVEQHVAPLRALPTLDYGFPPHIQRQFEACLRVVRRARA